MSKLGLISHKYSEDKSHYLLLGGLSNCRVINDPVLSYHHHVAALVISPLECTQTNYDLNLVLKRVFLIFMKKLFFKFKTEGHLTS